MSTWTIAWYELRRMFRSKSVIINLFLLPLILIFILGTVFSSTFNNGNQEFTPEVVKVAMVGGAGTKDGESSPLEAYLKSPEVAERIELHQVDTREEAERSVRAREVDYAVIVPSDFDTQVMSGTEARLELILGHSRIDNLVAGTVFDTILDEMNQSLAVSSVIGNIGEKPLNDTGGVNSGSSSDESSSMGTRESSNSSGSSSSDQAPPSYVTVGKLNDSGVSSTSSQYYASAMMIMFLLYSGGTASASLFNEKSNHTLYRLQSLPISSAQIFMGKMLGNSIVAIFQATVIITVSYLLYGVNWGNQPILLAVVCILLVVASMALAAMVTLMVRTSSSADAIMQVIIVAMTFLSGGFMPLPVDIINRIGLLTVNHWGMESLLQMMLHANTMETMKSIGMLASMCLILIVVTAGLYRKVGYHE
ncbi:ABC transporter permease [Paenibacillus sp. FA6]|uniref:ABC transporter permease n=1 Tax=Paenibacillus sp. FA6 TaxID=3413029 RepID=UPI003F659F97